MSKRVVIALGGNALGKTPKEQLEKVKEASKSLVDLIEQGYEIIVAHGNGPQVGMINLAFEEGAKVNDNIVKFDLPECSAMSQGYIGFHLQNALESEMKLRELPYHAATMVTQIEVDSADEAFTNPTKPIGSFYSKEQADEMMSKDSNLIMKEDSGRGYRQVVASPKPQRIVEKDAILNLLNNEFVVVACGGGGIPVVKNKAGNLVGIPSVIDKDFASAKLADEIDADYLIILTAVDRVAINFNTPSQEDVAEMSVEQADIYIKENQFAPGSMLPKVEAAKSFVKGNSKRKAIIASLEKASQAIAGESGTMIHQ